MQPFCTYFSFCWLVVSINCDWIENKGLWYYISEEEVDYQTAIEQCKSMNSRLAVITNDDQNDFLKRKMSANQLPRWIGLSTIKTYDHTGDACATRTYVWNYDIFCLNYYTNLKEMQDPSILTGCIGVTIMHNGWWVADECINNYGFICQWECKEIYMHFNSLHEHDGLYKLRHYSDGNFVYININSYDHINIHKTIIGGKTKWVLSITKETIYNIMATYETDSYVPYDGAMLWKKIQDIDIYSSSFCIDCDMLSLCVVLPNEDMIHFNHMNLNKELLFYHTDVAGQGSAIIRYNPRQLTTCIDVSMPNGNIHACGYIFPYPDYTTRIDVNVTYILYLFNECVTQNNTCITEEVTTPSDGLTQTSPYETTSSYPVDFKANNVVVITASVSVIVIIGIVVVIGILYFVIQRRRQNNQHDNVHQNKHLYYNNTTRRQENSSDDQANSEQSDIGVCYQNDSIARNGSISSYESVKRHDEKPVYYENENIPRDESPSIDKAGKEKDDQIAFYHNDNVHRDANPSDGQAGSRQTGVHYQNADEPQEEDTSNIEDDNKPNYEYISYQNDGADVTGHKDQKAYAHLDKPASHTLPYETLRQ